MIVNCIGVVIFVWMPQGAQNENGKRGIKLTRATAEQLVALAEEKRQVSIATVSHPSSDLHHCCNLQQSTAGYALHMGFQVAEWQAFDFILRLFSALICSLSQS